MAAREREAPVDSSVGCTIRVSFGLGCQAAAWLTMMNDYDSACAFLQLLKQLRACLPETVAGLRTPPHNSASMRSPPVYACGLLLCRLHVFKADLKVPEGHLVTQQAVPEATLRLERQLVRTHTRPACRKRAEGSS